MFNCKEKSLLLSLDTILESTKLEASSLEDPSDTLWFLDNDESIIMVVHPAYGIMFYNDEMHILGLYDRLEREAIVELLYDWSYDENSMVWREIGIDQVDYTLI